MERGRSKAHRPLPVEVRRVAVERGFAAYGRGAWYLAHEELEPAWMGTDDPGERALLSGIIKLAAAYVHAARGNPLGVRTNLRGARERLAGAAQINAAGVDDAPVVGAAATGGASATGATTTEPGPQPPGWADWIDLPVLLGEVDDRLVRIEALCSGPAAVSIARTGAAVPSHDVAGPVGRSPRAPVAISPIPLPRKHA